MKKIKNRLQLVFKERFAKKCIANITLNSSFLLIATMIAPVLYCSIIVLYAINVPVGDDYSLLAFINKFHVMEEFHDKINLLLSFHNEHRIVVLRIISLFVEAIFGSLNFSVLLLIGNALLFFVLLHVGRALDFGNDMFKWALLLLLSLQPQSLKLMFYPMAIIQAYLGLLFMVIYLRYLLEGKCFQLSMLVYVLAILNSGSGVFLVAIGGPLLFFQKRWKEFIVHLILSLIVTFLYFYGFSGQGVLRLNFLLEHSMQPVLFFLYLVGSIFKTPCLTPVFSRIPLVFGVLLMIYFVFFLAITIRTSHAKTRLIYIKQLVFLVSCIMMIALIVIGRTEIYQENLMRAARDGRYSMYGILFSAIVFISILQLLDVRGHLNAKGKLVIILLAITFNLSWYIIGFSQAAKLSHSRREAMVTFLANHNSSGLSTWAVTHGYAIKNLDLAISTGRYKP